MPTTHWLLSISSSRALTTQNFQMTQCAHYTHRFPSIRHCLTPYQFFYYIVYDYSQHTLLHYDYYSYYRWICYSKVFFVLFSEKEWNGGHRLHLKQKRLIQLRVSTYLCWYFFANLSSVSSTYDPTIPREVVSQILSLVIGNIPHRQGHELYDGYDFSVFVGLGFFLLKYYTFLIFLIIYLFRMCAMQRIIPLIFVWFFFSSVKSTVDWFVFMFFSFHSSTLVGKRSLCYLSFDSFPFSKVTHGIRKRKKL